MRLATEDRENTLKTRDSGLSNLESESVGKSETSTYTIDVEGLLIWGTEVGGPLDSQVQVQCPTCGVVV